MINEKRGIKLFICIAVMLTTATLYGFNRMSSAGRGSDTREKKTLKLVTEYKKNILNDISTDGRRLLFYLTEKPTRSYTVASDGSQVKANQSVVSEEVLRVVDKESGRETGRIKVGFFPLEQQFIPGTQQVFYSEPKADGGGQSYKLWDVPSGQTRVCLDAPDGNFSSVSFLDQQHALGTMSRGDGWELLGKLSLTDCTRVTIGSVDPDYQRSRVWGKLALSPDNRFVAYTIYAGSDVIIWDIVNKRIVKNLKPKPLFFGDKLIYTPDGKLLIVAASTNSLAGDNTQTYLLFYDTITYQQVRRLEVPGASAIAVSPDGRLLAVGFTKEEKKAFSSTEQAQIILYNLATGEEVVRASHPAVKQQRSDPFAAKVTKLAFTPDGKHLLSSTYDTLMWEVENRSGS